MRRIHIGALRLNRLQSDKLKPLKIALARRGIHNAYSQPRLQKLRFMWRYVFHISTNAMGALMFNGCPTPKFYAGQVSGAHLLARPAEASCFGAS